MRSILAPALLLMVPLAGCGVRASQGAPAVPVETAVAVKTAPVATRTVPRTLTFTGTLAAHRESAVAAAVAGQVAATYVERGSRVGKGAPLVRLDARTAELVEAEARAQSAALEAQRSQALIDCGRAEKLYAQGAITEAEHQRTATQCQASTFTANAADARQRQAAKTLDDLVIRAPFSGVIAERTVSEGEFVRPDSKVVTLVQLDPLEVQLAVPEGALSRLQVGARLEFKVAAYPDTVFVAKVNTLGASVRPTTRDLIVDALVDNKDAMLRPGMFVTAQVNLGDTTVPTVPTGAVRESAGAQRVFVVENERLSERLVQVGPARDDVFPVLAGLRAGERVVVAPRPELRDGLRVR